jgi:hypothetical protein
MNPHWPDYVALRRGCGAFADSAMMAFVFKQRLSALLRIIKSSKILGEVGGFVWRIEYQKRGLPHAHILLWSHFDTEDIAAIDRVINVRYPKPSPFLNEDAKVPDWRSLIDAYQIHHHSARCMPDGGPCKYGYTQPPQPHTIIRRKRYVFARGKKMATLSRIISSCSTCFALITVWRSSIRTRRLDMS